MNCNKMLNTKTDDKKLDVLFLPSICVISTYIFILLDGVFMLQFFSEKCVNNFLQSPKLIDPTLT